MSTLQLTGISSAVVTASQSAIDARDSALADASLITRVASPSGLASAVATMRDLKGIAKQAEDSRVAIKAPVLEITRRIDAAAAEFSEPLKAEINRINGWWDARANLIATEMPGAKEAVVLSCLGLITSEVAEAMEAVRKHPVETWHDAQTKDTLVRELAGAVVRCMDLAERLSLPLGAAIIEEITANAERGYMHGGKKA